MAFDKQVCEKAENEIKQRRLRAEAAARERIAEIEEKMPEIAEIRDRLAQTSIELSKLIIGRKDGFKENFEKIKTQNLQGQEMIASLLKAAGCPQDYLEPAYTCPVCRDKGFVNGERCSCYEKLLTKYAVEKLNSEANMPDCDFEHFSLDYYRGKTSTDCADCYAQMAKNLSFCKEFAQHFSNRAPSLFLMGKTGTGKTHMSLAIAKEVSKGGHTVAYGSLLNYLGIIEKEHFGRSADPDADTMNTLLSADLLVLDDLGSEFRTGFYESALYNIINSRINLGLPTIISTNLTAAELQKNYNDRIISRLFSVYTTLRFVGEDIRQIKRLRDEF